MPPVTRIELLDHIEKAFDGGPASRDDLIAAAEATTARPQVLAVLHTLPTATYRNPRDLWEHLTHLPVTA